MDYANLKGKVAQYHKMLANIESYRKAWLEKSKPMLLEELKNLLGETGLVAKIESKDDLENLEAIALTLGQDDSGISEPVGDTKRNLIKSKGMLIYQQLFNGKIMITIVYPFIEGLGQPKQPKMIEILRPDELTKPFVLRHVEEFLKEIIAWEDFDDDEPIAPIGFQTGLPQDELIQTLDK